MIRDHQGRAGERQRNIQRRRWGCCLVSSDLRQKRKTYDWAETAATAAAPMKAEVILTILFDLVLVCGTCM